jgi:hypothetical protein
MRRFSFVLFKGTDLYEENAVKCLDGERKLSILRN